MGKIFRIVLVVAFLLMVGLPQASAENWKFAFENNVSDFYLDLDNVRGSYYR